MLNAQFTAENVVGTEQDFSVRTGVVQFKDDWPGVFIRGDDALGHAAVIRALLRHVRAGTLQPDEWQYWGALEELAELLASCRVPKRDA